jgi:hypothetical protein
MVRRDGAKFYSSAKRIARFAESGFMGAYPSAAALATLAIRKSSALVTKLLRAVRRIIQNQVSAQRTSSAHGSRYEIPSSEEVGVLAGVFIRSMPMTTCTLKNLHPTSNPARGAI